MSQHHRIKWTSSDLRKWKPIIAATLPARCIERRCVMGGMVYPEQAWQVGHRIGVADPRSSNTAENLGPSHRKCNASAGGKAGTAVQGKTKRDDRRLPQW